MLATQMKPNAKTLPHELGHALGLAHPFENAANPASTTCPVNTNCDTDGDQVCDTDPITIPPTYTARTGTNPCTGTAFNNNTEHNFMNYTQYFTLFTAGQRDLMLGAMTLPMRASLAGSWAKASGYPYTFSPPTITTCASVSGSIGTSNVIAGLLGVGVDNRRFSSGITATDPGYVDKTSSPLHLIPLNAGGSYSFSADLFSVNHQQVAAWIDYDNDGEFDNATELLLYSDGILAGSNITRISTAFTIPAFAVTNTVIRMRVIEEISSGYGPYNPVIGDACYQPIYGQTEDFPVFITSILADNWKYFQGEQRPGNEVILNWGISEGDTKHFVVERSVDGTTFEKIGTVPAFASVSSYTFFDRNAVLPMYHYRIRQIDESNNEEYSRVVIVRGKQRESDQSIKVINPFNETITFELDNAYQLPATVSLLDLNGKTILQTTLPAEQKRLSIAVRHKQLSAGIYILQIHAGGTVIRKKMLRQ
jgi:hypothetical protein